MSAATSADGSLDVTIHRVGDHDAVSAHVGDEKLVVMPDHAGRGLTLVGSGSSIGNCLLLANRIDRLRNGDG